METMDKILMWCWNAVACLVVIGGVALIITQLMMAIAE